VTVGASAVIGFVAAIVCNFAAHYRSKSALDDTLDVFPCHGVGGMVGMVLTAVFAEKVGLLSGETATFVHHLIALVGVSAFVLMGSYLLYMLSHAIIPMRVTHDEEFTGLDLSQHGESFGSPVSVTAYDAPAMRKAA
jgi:Amt family ammonium transporter